MRLALARVLITSGLTRSDEANAALGSEFEVSFGDCNIAEAKA